MFHSLCEGQSHKIKTVSTDHNLFEEKGEPKRIRTEALPLTSLTPYPYGKPAHNLLLALTSFFVKIRSNVDV